MEKRINHGFNRGVLGLVETKAKVFFEYFNDKIVKCHLVMDGNGLPQEFIGVSKLDPRDTYDRNAGEKISLDKALAKYGRYLEQKNRRTLDVIASRFARFVDLQEGCIKKLSKIQHNK